MDLAAYLKHLQTVFYKFNANAVISEPVLIRLLCNGLRSSIRAQTEQKDCQKDTWYQSIKKAITAETKAALNLLLSVAEIDACYPWGHRSASEPTKDYTWDRSSFLFCPYKVRAMPPHCSNP